MIVVKSFIGMNDYFLILFLIPSYSIPQVTGLATVALVTECSLPLTDLSTLEGGIPTDK
jgi:hypothetical protein